MATSDAVLEVNDANFADEVEGSATLTMVDFWAVWCGPCKMIAPIVEQVATDYAERGLRVAKLDVDQNPQTTTRFRVTSIPSLLFFKDGEVVDRVVGAVPRSTLEDKIEQLL